MLIGLQPIYYTRCAGHVIKIVLCATLCHLKKPKLPFRKTCCGKFLDVKLARFALRITALMENNRSTATEFGKGVLSCHYKYIHPNLSIH